jgi:signal peptidase I
MNGVQLAAVIAAPAAAAAAAMAWARRRFMLITVKGNSMAPTYRNGERLIVRRGGYAAGEVVMLRAPDRPGLGVDWLVKRVVATSGDDVPADLAERAGVVVVPAGRLLVRSDATQGLDSRQLGLIDDGDVIGVVRRSRGMPRASTANHSPDPRPTGG